MMGLCYLAPSWCLAPESYPLVLSQKCWCKVSYLLFLIESQSLQLAGTFNYGYVYYTLCIRSYGERETFLLMLRTRKMAITDVSMFVYIQCQSLFLCSSIPWSIFSLAVVCTTATGSCFQLLLTDVISSTYDLGIIFEKIGKYGIKDR